MKKIIFLYNSPVFDANIAAIYNKNKHELILLTSLKNYEELLKKGQESLFDEIHILPEVNFANAERVIASVISKSPNTEIILTTRTEKCISLAGKLRDHFKIKGMNGQLSQCFTDKNDMKKALKNTAIRCPKYVLFDRTLFLNNKEKYFSETVQYLGLPFFAKPIDEANTRGAFKVNAIEDLIELTTTEKQYELDEFIEGRLFHVDSFIKNKKILTTWVCEYSFPPFYFLNGKPLGSIPLDEKDLFYKEATTFNANVIKELNFQDSGATHLEFFRTNTGELVFLEIAARPAGAWIPEIYCHRFGINLSDEMFKLQCINDYENVNLNVGNYAAGFMLPCPEGFVEKINFPTIKSRFKFDNLLPLQQPSKKSSSLQDIGAKLILWNKDLETLRSDFEIIKEHQFFVISDDMPE